METTYYGNEPKHMIMFTAQVDREWQIENLVYTFETWLVYFQKNLKVYI